MLEAPSCGARRESDGRTYRLTARVSRKTNWAARRSPARSEIVAAPQAENHPDLSTPQIALCHSNVAPGCLVSTPDAHRRPLLALALALLVCLLDGRYEEAD